MSWPNQQLNQQQLQQASQHQQQGHIVLLLAGSLLAPFTLLTCLALYKLSEWRQTKPQAGCRRAAARQLAMVGWLAAAAAFVAVGANYAVLQDRSIELGPGDQRLMQLGIWAGLCGVVALNADIPFELRVIGPGLTRARWPAETFTRGLGGQMVGQDMRTAWELPALGLGRSGTLTVGANFRHRVRLELLRRRGGDQEPEDEEKRVELVDDVKGINLVTTYNLTDPGRLSLRLTNLDTRATGTANFSFSVAVTAWRFAATNLSAVGASHMMDCRLGQDSCRLDNPAAWLVLQALPADPGEPSRAARKSGLRVRCELLVPIAKAAPAILAGLVCLPCILLLAANALLAGQCWIPIVGGIGKQRRRSSLASPGSSGRGKQLGVRFQLDNKPELAIEKY